MIVLLSLTAMIGGAQASTHAAAHRVYSVAAGDMADRQYRPRLMLLTGDGTLTMHRSYWREWNRREARGRGVGYLENCIPDCGHSTRVRHVPMHLKAYRVRVRCGVRVFTRYRETFVRKPRSDMPRIYVLHIGHPACNA